MALIPQITPPIHLVEVPRRPNRKLYGQRRVINFPPDTPPETRRKQPEQPQKPTSSINIAPQVVQASLIARDPERKLGGKGWRNAGITFI